MWRNPDSELRALFRESYFDPLAAQRLYIYLTRLNFDIGFWFADHILQQFLFNRKRVLDELNDVGAYLICNFDDPEINFQRWTEPLIFSLPGYPGEDETPGMKTIKLRIKYECQLGAKEKFEKSPSFTVPLHLKAPLRIEYLIEDEQDPLEESWRPPFDFKVLEETGWTNVAFIKRVGTLINHLIRAATEMEIGRRGYGLNLMATNLLKRFLEEKNQILIDPPVIIPIEFRSSFDYDDRYSPFPEEMILERYHSSLWRETFGSTVYRPQDDLHIQASYSGTAHPRKLRNQIYLYLDLFRYREDDAEPFSTIYLEENWTDEDFILAYLNLVQRFSR